MCWCLFDCCLCVALVRVVFFVGVSRLCLLCCVCWFAFVVALLYV